ncbi:MAG TPA: YciI-like protein [Acidimicrobiales bacterium]
MYWLLFYDYVDGIAERRGPFRDAHLALAREAQDAGTLLAAGALADPLDGAVFVFRADDASVVEAFVGKDPYVKAGLVTGWRVRRWTVVVGGEWK